MFMTRLLHVYDTFILPMLLHCYYTAMLLLCCYYFVITKGLASVFCGIKRGLATQQNVIETRSDGHGFPGFRERLLIISLSLLHIQQEATVSAQA